MKGCTIEMDTNDGCVASKTKLRDQEGVMGPPAPVLDNTQTEDMNSQPATQPLCESQESFNEDLNLSTQEDKPWAMLLPYRRNWQRVPLYRDEVSIGRSTANTHSIGEMEAGGFCALISKVHFIISKTKDGVKIEDKSSNGTSVNGKPIGRGRSIVLDHNSIISIAKAKTYVFMYTRSSLMLEYPLELRRNYIVSGDLGSGACGCVKLGFHVDGVAHPYPVAIKIINKRSLSQTPGTTNVMNEVKILREVNHPAVIRLEDVVETHTHLYIILELAAGGELFDKIIQKTKFNEMEAKLHFYQMVSGIKYLHSRKIAHRDLKPENILLCSEDDSRPIVKITDMGLSKLIAGDSFCRTFCGTPQYIAPEVLKSRMQKNCPYDFKVDMWSLGVILYILLSGCPPFNPERRDKPLLNQIYSGDYSFPERQWKDISSSAIDLIKKLMCLDPVTRLSAKQALEHPWLNDPTVKATVESLWKGEKKSRDVTDEGPKRQASGDTLSPISKRPRVELPEVDAQTGNEEEEAFSAPPAMSITHEAIPAN